MKKVARSRTRTVPVIVDVACVLGVVTTRTPSQAEQVVFAACSSVGLDVSAAGNLEPEAYLRMQLAARPATRHLLCLLRLPAHWARSA